MSTAATPPSATLTLLHLSDLHFGQARGEGRIHFDQRKVVSELVKDAAKMRQALGSPDAVLVTGDIAFKADPAEYRQADDWLRELAHAVGVSPEKVWLVPGNHDVDRGQGTKPLTRKKVHQSLKASPGELDDYMLAENSEALASDLWPKLQLYAEFARPWAAPTLSAAEPFWKRERDSAVGKLTLVGLNSCLLSLDNTDKRENLALSKAQLHRLLDSLPKDALTLALMHHPPEWLSDGDELLKELQKHPHLLFTGHVHTLGGGANHGLGQGGRLHLTAGAAHASPTEPGQHSYAWIRLSKDGLTWYPRVYSERWNEFRADADKLKEGTICQTLERNVLPEKLKEWLALPPPPLPRPLLIPDVWCKELRRRFEHLNLNADGKIVRPRLDELYVSLKTDWCSDEERERSRDSEDGWDGSDPEPGDYDFEAEIGLHEPSNVSISPGDRYLADLLTHKELHFAIQGGPGSGKSTFLRIAALQSIRSRRRMPILLQLKDFAAWLSDSGSKGESAELLVSWAGHALADFELDAAGLHARLGRGETLWLLDGLDEIFDVTLRLRVAHILDRFIHGNLGRRERAIVTSRPHALDDAQVQQALGLLTTTARIKDLDQSGQHKLLEHWFRAMYEPEVEHQAHTEARRMLEHLEAHAYLRDLRGNPLLLTTLANLYFSNRTLSNRTLPERRTQLFEQMVQKLLERRFGVGADGGSPEKVRRVRRALAAVARQMMESRAVRDLKDLAFRQKLDAAWSPSESDPTVRALEIEQLAIELGCHTGLLLMDGHPSVYRFSHLILQEYLAAWSIGQEASPFDGLKARLDDGAWRETLLLTAGYLGMAGGETLATDFLEGLLAHRGDGKPLCRRLELAVQCAVEVPGDTLSPTMKQTLQTLAVEALSDKQSLSPILDRVNLGLALGRLGDPRLGLDKPENWIWIPPGEFMMGSDEGPHHEGPDHKVTLARGFFMSRFPVTNHDFKAFIDARGYQHKKWWSEDGWKFCQKNRLKYPSVWNQPQWNGSNQPVVGVSWYETEAFCNWLSARHFSTGVSGPFRLPTEAEWEYAARGREGRRYPWGNEELTPERANYSNHIGAPSPVGAFPLGATPDRIEEMVGNVSTICDERFFKSLKATIGDPILLAEVTTSMGVRGCCYHDSADKLNPFFRQGTGITTRDLGTGFRLVRVSPQPPTPTGLSPYSQRPSPHDS